jgi:hypothetical protein
VPKGAEEVLNELKMSDLHAAVWQFLLDRFVGVENALPRAAIVVRYNLVNKKELSDRVFRQVVSDLVTDFKKAICTTPAAGYYVARTGRELDAAVNDLKAKGSAIFERARALEATEPLEKQERLF